MKRLLIITVQLLMSMMLFSCKGEKQFNEYEALKSDAFQNERLYETVNEYDLSHPDFFESKVDLMSIFILSSDYAKAQEYLIRAEQVIKNAKSEKYLCNFYGLKSSLLLHEKKLDQALEWCEKALAIPEHRARYGFLKAQILYAKNDKKNSLETFRNAFSTNDTYSSPDDMQKYSELLAENQEYDECLVYLNKILEKGFYYYGLGQFTSSIYEKKDMLFEAIITSFLDYEYASCFYNNDENEVLKNLHIINLRYKKSNKSEEVTKATECIAAVIKGEGNFPVNADSNLLFYKYLKTKYEIITGKNLDEAFNSLLSLENSFNSFPVYHYLIAEATSKLESVDTAVECYENILEFRPNRYSEYARYNLGKSLGLKDEDCNSIMTFSEIEKYFNEYISSNNDVILSAFCNLLSLPDNKYVFFAQELIKSNISNSNLKTRLNEKYKVADGRLKERLEYILIQ